MKIFFTSDLHFGHENIIRLDNRPFNSVKQMDEEIIKRWNAKVNKGDLVYILGDMIWKPQDNNAANIIQSLNGQKILIKGNHDRVLHNAKVKTLFSAIKDYDDIKVVLQDGHTKRCILSHYPIFFYNGHYHESIMLYGHVHNTREYDLTRDYAKWLNENDCPMEMYNVGCMLWDYEPVTLDEILVRSDTY